LSDEARQALAAGHLETAVHSFREALGLWRGPAYADLANEPFIMPEANRLKEKWLKAFEDRIDAELALARHADLVGELEGRVRELVQNGRMVTLTGAGGIGKTRLAIEVGRSLAADYSDGVALVELAPLVDPDLVPQTIGVILGVAGGRSLTEALTDYLRTRCLLLVLDNCEHLIDSCARLAKVLLEACSELRIMATSREALGIDGEMAWRVPSLSLPQSERAVPTEQLTTYGALALFVDRARVAGGSFALR